MNCGANVKVSVLHRWGYEAGIRSGDADGLFLRHTPPIQGLLRAEAAQAGVQIVVSSQQQTIGMDQMALAMESLNAASTQNAAGTKQAETAAQDLYQVGQRLSRLVERFRV